MMLAFPSLILSLLVIFFSFNVFFFIRPTYPKSGSAFDVKRKKVLASYQKKVSPEPSRISRQAVIGDLGTQ